MIIDYSVLDKIPSLSEEELDCLLDEISKQREMLNRIKKVITHEKYINRADIRHKLFLKRREEEEKERRARWVEAYRRVYGLERNVESKAQIARSWERSTTVVCNAIKNFERHLSRRANLRQEWIPDDVRQHWQARIEKIYAEIKMMD